MAIRATVSNITLQLESPDTYTSGCVQQTCLHFISPSLAVPKLGEANRPALGKSTNQYRQKDMAHHKCGMGEEWYEKYKKIYKL